MCIYEKIHVVYLRIYETQLYQENLQHTRCETADASNNSHWIRNRINQTFVSGCFTPPCTSNSFVSVHVTVSIHFQLSREPVTHTVWNYRCTQTSCWRRVQVDLIVVLHIRFDTLYLYEFKLIWLWCYTSDLTHSIFTQNTGMCRCAKCVWHVLPKPTSYDCRSEMRKRQRIIMSFVQTYHHSLHLGSWIFLFPFHKYQVNIRGLVDVQICGQVSHHCNAMTLAIWRSTWGDKFSNMAIRTRFHPYYVTNFTFEPWVNNLINLYPQPTMSSSCVSHFPWNCILFMIFFSQLHATTRLLTFFLRVPRSSFAWLADCGTTVTLMRRGCFRSFRELIPDLRFYTYVRNTPHGRGP